MDSEGTRGELHRRNALCRRNVTMYPGPGRQCGEFTAWDPGAREAAWKIKEDFPVWSGTVTTAGEVVFYGTMDGWFKAVDARTGTDALAV